VQLDEIWAFVYAKNDNVRDTNPLRRAGDVWTWTAICADTKLLITTLVGRRDTRYAVHFVNDLRKRLANPRADYQRRPRPYLTAVDTVFRDDVDFARFVKIYGADAQGEKRYSPAICLGAKKASRDRRPEPEAYQHVICRTPEPYNADAYAPLHAPD